MEKKGVSFSEMQRRAWEREYARKGPLWCGPALFDFKIPGSMHVLELGCGNGKTLEALVKTGAKVTAIDFSPKAVALCKGLAREKGWNDIELLIADACDLPFPDSSFDAVVAFHLLEHLLEGDRQKAVSEIKRVLRKGGTVFVQAFSTDDMRFGKGEELEENTFVRGTGMISHYFTEEEMKVLFSGFSEKFMERTSKEKHYHGKEFKRDRIIAVYERC